MVRKYVRKTKSWTSDAMRKAIEAVIKKGCSIKTASIDHEVPHATLSRKVHQCRCDPEKEIELIVNPKGRNLQTVFSKQQEIILCQYINTLEAQMIGLTGVDIRRLAYQVAEKFKIPHRFNKECGAAGEDWYRGFLKRNPQVAVKKVDLLTEKTQEFKKEKVYKFFDLLESTITKYDLNAGDIYNVDETVITCSSKSDFEIMEKRQSKHQISVEKNKLVTAVMCFSASGVYVPLMLIFPTKIKSKLLLKGAPSGSWAEFDETGQMQTEIFMKWLSRFIEFSKASKDSPVLLLVDGYRSYLKNLEVLIKAEENGVHMICLPPNCTTKLQPIRHNFMKSLSSAYTQEVTKWTDNVPRNSVSIKEVYKLFGNAFMKVSTATIPINSFRSTGIWPPDRHLFEEDIVLNSRSDTSIDNENSSQFLSELFKSTVDNTEIVPDIIAVNKLTNIVHEPIVVIIQDHDKKCTIPQIENQENNQQIVQQQLALQPIHQQIIQQQYQSIRNNNIQQMQLENVALVEQNLQNDHHNQHNVEMCSVLIPPEAQLSEVQAEELPHLVQSQSKLYFYVSPFKLNLST